MNNLQPVRTPRPLGTTEKGYHHFKHHSQESKQNLQRHIIQHYINNNFLYCERHYTIHELSILLDIPTSTIMAYTIQEGHNIQANMDKLTSGEALRALFAQGIMCTLEDRSRALQQYSILAASQGEGYKAFVSGEVNKALKLVMETGTNMVNLTKSLSGGGNTLNVLMQNTDGAQQGNQDTVSMDQVVMEIKELGVIPLAFNEDKLKSLYSHNALDDLPEVSALKQEGVDTSKEALSMKDITKLPVDHEDRRAHEEGHNLDADEVH